MKINNYPSPQFHNPQPGISIDTLDNFVNQSQGVAAQLTGGNIQAAGDLNMSIKYQVSALYDTGAITQDQKVNLEQILDKMQNDISKDDRESFSDHIRSFTKALYNLVNQ